MASPATIMLATVVPKQTAIWNGVTIHHPFLPAQHNPEHEHT